MLVGSGRSAQLFQLQVVFDVRDGLICEASLTQNCSCAGSLADQDQLIPQIIINYRRQNATGLQPTMMMFWAWAGVPLGVYNIVKDFNIALQIQPQMLAFLSLTTWIQVYYYEEVCLNLLHKSDCC